MYKPCRVSKTASLQVPVKPVLDPENAYDRSLFSSLNFRGDPQPEKPMRGPRTYYPDGRRYSVEGHHVKWQGWEFDFGVKTIQGIHVDDVRFKGERVAYELSLQELASIYSGDSPMSMHTAVFDSIVFLGREIFEMIPGIDCPEHATFFDFVHYYLGKAFVFKNSVCLFEHDMGIPLRRHYETDHAGDYQYVQGMNDNALILRSIVVAYNYEYINDIIFRQQGGIETKLTLSGYILSGFFTPESDSSRGFEVYPNGQGNIHHHFVNFKVDLDIKGTSNRFETYDIVQEKFDDPVDVGEKISGNRFVRNLRQGESDAQFTPDPNQYLIFFNDKHENDYGNKQGYRLQMFHGSGILHGDDYRISRGAAVFKNPVS
jgi:diamine oxidase